MLLILFNARLKACYTPGMKGYDFTEQSAFGMYH